VPTAVLLDGAGSPAGRVTGWDQPALAELLGRAGKLAGVSGTPGVPGREAPLRKPGCASKVAIDPSLVEAMRSGGLDELEEMFERGFTDGLPVVPPTRQRVEAMLAGRDGKASLGPVPPVMGEATLERVAACAVLAGCRPAYFPVVLAAEAVLDPAFNLHGQAVTTQPAGQLVVVNGPVRHETGLNSGMGALGPGWRANMTIGRALRLVVGLTGGGMPGALDRATLGHPGKLGFCVAEAEEHSPFEPLHVERGYRAGQSASPSSAATRRCRSPTTARARPRSSPTSSPGRQRASGARTGGRSRSRRCSSSAPSTPRCSAPPAGARRASPGDLRRGEASGRRAVPGRDHGRRGAGRPGGGRDEVGLAGVDRPPRRRRRGRPLLCGARAVHRHGLADRLAGGRPSMRTWPRA
jgi:hypothetical protein